MEELGQALLRRCDVSTGVLPLGPLGPLARRPRPAAASLDAYEEHLLLPRERVALLTNHRLLLVEAHKFGNLQAIAESGGSSRISEDDVPAATVIWGVQWQVCPGPLPRLSIASYHLY